MRTEFETHRGIVRAVNGISFAVQHGEIVGIVGETGCGKSATARSIVGLVRPPGRLASGSVRFEGKELASLSQRALREIRGVGIGFVPQNPFAALNPVLRIRVQFRNLLRAHYGRTRPAAYIAVAEEMLTAVGIADPSRVLGGYAHELSGGMAQRVVIALALALNPRLVIADEPTTGLDVTVQRQILDLIQALVRGSGRSMIIVTHDLGVVAQYCNRVLVMYAGTIVESGPVEHVFTSPEHPYTAALRDAILSEDGRPAGLPGAVPSLIDFPEGCPFRERCAYAMHRCVTERPSLRPTSGERELACHLDSGVKSACS